MQLITNGVPRKFAQILVSGSTGEWVVREGTLGRTGRVHETNLPAATPIGEIAQPYFAKGFTEFDEGDYLWVVVQFPTRNSAAARRLIAQASDWIASTLDAAS